MLEHYKISYGPLNNGIHEHSFREYVFHDEGFGTFSQEALLCSILKLRVVLT